jgi:multidrug efflux system membrane fusion protein
MRQWIGRHSAIAVIACGVLLFLLYELSTVIFAYTGDSYVMADVVTVAPEVPGTITELLVRDNERVRQGQPLFVLDERPFALAVAQQEAAVALAQANLAQARAAVEQFQADVSARGAELADARETRERVRALAQRGDMPQQRFDDATRDADVANAASERAAAALAVVQRAIGVRDAELRAAQAALDRTAYDLARARVSAPAAGRVVPFTARVGDYAPVGRAVLAIVTDTNWRVVANVPERHLSRLAPGQAVWLTLGGQPWVIHRGRVRSIAGGIARDPGSSGVMPYITPTTDWIRLPYRFPVEIDLVSPPAIDRLHVGADARVLIWF